MMRRLIFSTAVLIASVLSPSIARADGTCTTAPTAKATWGGASLSNTTNPTPTSTSDESSPVSRARDLLARAKLLDEAATSEEKSAVEIATRLPTLRATAKTARDRADRASGDDREALVSRAEDLEADLAVSEAETAAKRRSAADNRRVARDLRVRAVRLVREAPTEPTSIGSPCDPPYRFTSDGRKIYRVECLK